MVYFNKTNPIRHKTLLNLSILAAAAGLMTGGQPGEVLNDTKKPNVLFISIDDLRPELGCYGNREIKTPNIDKFAKEGVVFTQTYCQAAVCAPSRASLMTGLRPDSTRVWHLGDKFRETIPNVLTMPQYFHQFGYYTVSMGKIFHNYMPDSVSWDEPDLRPAPYNTKDMIDRDAETFYYDDEIRKKQKEQREETVNMNPKAYASGWNHGPALEVADLPDETFYDGAQTDLAIETLRKLKDKDQPFYLAVGYYRPHLPFVVPKKYWDLYDPDSISLAPNPFLPRGAPIMAMNSMYELRGYWGFEHIKHPIEYHVPDDTARMLKHGYYASVSYVDACVGKLLDELKRLDLYDNTIIVVWGDHGWKLGEHNSWCKQTNYDIDTHSPMIIYAPGIKAKGSKCDRLTELVDIFPTLCDLAGIDVPTYLQGKSVASLMNQPNLEWKKAVFSQFHRRPRISPDGKRYMGYSITTERYHYVEWHYWDNDKKSAGELAALELYDRLVDPQENDNVANLPENRETIKQLADQLKAGWRGALPD